MKQHIKREWVKRLNSGMYPQGYSRLRRDVEGKAFYCCLGVLCEMAMEAGVVIRGDENGDVQKGVRRYTSVAEPETDFASLYLPQAVADWAELGDSEQKNLGWMNDQGCTFDYIASCIEKDL